MNILIAYGSKNGAAEKCARYLQQKLPGSQLVNLQTETPELTGYDGIILGSCIRMGALHKEVRKFIGRNQTKLGHLPAAYFLSCLFPEGEQYFNSQFPKELIEKAVTRQCVGGEMDWAKLKGMDRFVAKMVSKSEMGQKMPSPAIRWDKLDQLASKMEEAVQKSGKR